MSSSVHAGTHPGAPLVPNDHGIVVALDVPTPERVRDLVEATADVDGVVGYKLGPTMALTLGLAAALELIAARTDLPVIYDHQKAGLDIPANADGFATVLADHGVRAAIVFPLAGPTAAREYPAALRRQGVVPLVGGVLSVDDYVQSAGGWVADSALFDIAEAAASLGESHLIAPIGSAARGVVAAAGRHGIRPQLFVPGISGDGEQLASLAEVGAYVDGVYPIVGRAITRATDPATVADQLVTRLRDALARSTSTTAPDAVPAGGPSVRDLAGDVVERAAAAGLRIATVETVTAGRLSSALTEVPGASLVFERGSPSTTRTRRRAVSASTRRSRNGRAPSVPRSPGRSPRASRPQPRRSSASRSPATPAPPAEPRKTRSVPSMWRSTVAPGE